MDNVPQGTPSTSSESRFLSVTKDSLILLDCQASESQELSCLFPKTWDCKCTPVCIAFHLSARDHIQAVMLFGKHFTK